MLLKSIPPPPPPTTQFEYYLTYFLNKKGYDGEEADQDEDRGGVCCKVKFRRNGGEHKLGKKQEDEERGVGVCPGCGG